MPKKLLEGQVVSDTLDKTCTVKVLRRVKHPKYGKFMARSKNYLVHDPENKASKGQYVLIEETRPLSARKRFALKDILKDGVIVQ